MIKIGIFKAYDIRGIYPTEINEDIAYRIGRALVSFLGCRSVIVGRDMRLSSEELFKALARGIIEQGADLYEVGLCSTDMVYFATGFYKMDAGVMITASHNPKDYNGIKFCREMAIPIGSDSGLADIERIFNDSSFKQPARKGGHFKKEIMEDFAKKAFSIVDPQKLRPLKIAVDAGNGIAGLIVSKIAEKLPCKVIPLYFELDGSFPNHQPSPIEAENRKDLVELVKKEKADLGMAFDGDGDRVFFIDDKGELLTASFMTAMIAKRMLAKYPSSNIIYNAVCSKIVPDTIEKCGGRPIIWKVGHAFIKKMMREKDAPFGGEHSGHYYFRDFFYADSGIIAALIILEIVSEAGKPLSELKKEYEKYASLEETNFRVDNKQAKIEEIRKKHTNAKRILDLDGLSFYYDDWWFNVRPSNTEPLLRLNLEADTKEKLEEMKKRLTEEINS